MIDIITHASKVFKTTDTILKDTPIVERLRFETILLAEPIDTTSEEPIDDLVAKLEHVVLCD